VKVAWVQVGYDRY